jgi:hypothetical protein
MVLAIIADALQIVIFPLFVEGALSPAGDILSSNRVQKVSQPAYLPLPGLAERQAIR